MFLFILGMMGGWNTTKRSLLCLGRLKTGFNGKYFASARNSSISFLPPAIYDCFRYTSNESLIAIHQCFKKQFL